MKGVKLCVFLISVFVLNACKNDLKLNAPYKEIPSIYAVLNPQEKIQIIRVNKVFLGEGDANQMAKIADSINYQAGDLTIALKHSSNTTIVFRDSIVKANEGVFSTTQRVYVSSEKLAVNGTYTLVVTNNKTGNVFRASAAALDSITPYYGSLVGPYYPYSPQEIQTNYVDYSEQTKTYYLNTQYDKDKDKDKQVFQFVIRLHFFNNKDAGNTTDYVDYAFGNQDIAEVPLKTVSGSLGIKMIETRFTGADLFSSIGVALAKKGINNSLPKKMFKIQYFLYSTTKEYADYMKFSSPSLSISQNNALYSNFESGAALGIFTFRSRTTICKNISNTFITEFQRNSATCSYLFLNADESRRGCP
jgi:hypothetical protein